MNIKSFWRSHPYNKWIFIEEIMSSRDSAHSFTLFTSVLNIICLFGLRFLRSTNVSCILYYGKPSTFSANYLKMECVCMCVCVHKHTIIDIGPVWPPAGNTSKHTNYLSSSVIVCIFCVWVSLYQGERQSKGDEEWDKKQLKLCWTRRAEIIKKLMRKCEHI